jgi:hypothetical protein
MIPNATPRELAALLRATRAAIREAQATNFAEKLVELCTDPDGRVQKLEAKWNRAKVRMSWLERQVALAYQILELLDGVRVEPHEEFLRAKIQAFEQVRAAKPSDVPEPYGSDDSELRLGA